MPKLEVTVTFLRQEHLPPGAGGLPRDVQLVRVSHPSVSFYRYLYNTIGFEYIWWLRRTMSDADIASLLNHPDVGIYVLYRGGEPAGFFELDARHGVVVNIAYFGLFQHAIGKGLGPGLLHAACAIAWERKPKFVTVNTCTADHPRALNTYLKAGFEIYRRIPEVWDVPDQLGFNVKPTLLAK